MLTIISCPSRLPILANNATQPTAGWSVHSFMYSQMFVKHLLCDKHGEFRREELELPLSRSLQFQCSDERKHDPRRQASDGCVHAPRDAGAVESSVLNFLVFHKLEATVT